MATNLTRVAISIILIWATAYASCTKNCIDTKYSFEIGIKAYPNLDSININDTLWFEINAPTTLKDKTTGNMIDYSSAGNLGTTLSFGEFIGGSISNPGGIAAVSSFGYKLITGDEISTYLPEQVKAYNFIETPGMYNFKLAIIAKKKGIFAISVGNAANVFRKDDKCTKAAFAIPLKETNNHIYFLQQNRPGYTPSGLELTNMYRFKVK